MATFLVDNPSPPTHVLMIAYFYPPRVSTGSIRVVKFIKYLPENGYQPAVLTTRMRGTLPDDRETLTFRSDELVGIVQRAYRSWKLRHVPPERRATLAVANRESRIERWRTALSIPDHQIFWYPLAVQKGLSVIRSLPIRLLYSTSPPETGHLVAMRLKQRTGLPWVADFRDGWLFEPLIPMRYTVPMRHFIEARLERAVMLQADHIITAGAPLAEDFERRYPEAAAKISVLPNGYDPEDFAHLPQRIPRSEKCRVVHTGTLSLSRGGTSLDGLIKALRSMQADHLPLLEDLEVVLVGDLTPRELEMIEQSGVRGNFSTVSRVPYHQALEYQVQADVLLFIVTSQVTSHSSNKLFEYLATGRPILALASQSSIVRTVSQLGMGFIVDPDDWAGIRRALQTFHAQWKAGLLPTRVHEQVRQFDRRELTRKLAAIFDRLLESGGNP
jgi:glycosyltransferase involved in cell wall biosynthesis